MTGESAAMAEQELRGILEELRQEDPEFSGAAHLVFARSPYETPAGHSLPSLLRQVSERRGIAAAPVGMSFWTDAAILGEAGIPSVLFGPGGAGLHSVEEYVNVEDVLACRDVLAELALTWTPRAP